MHAGIELSGDPDGEEAKVAFILRWLSVLEFDDASARACANVFPSLRASGTLSTDMGLFIAYVAIANGHVLLTRHVRHFDRIPGLIVYGY